MACSILLFVSLFVRHAYCTGGPSINDMSEEMFVSIRAHADVWGVNFLARHPFIEPDYNGLELDKATNEYCPGAIGLTSVT